MDRVFALMRPKHKGKFELLGKGNMKVIFAGMGLKH